MYTLSQQLSRSRKFNLIAVKEAARQKSSPCRVILRTTINNKSKKYGNLPALIDHLIDHNY